MVRTAYPYLQQLQQDFDMGKENYLHQNYDTYIFYPQFTENNVLMVRNAFIEALNRRLKLPSAVVIILSDQIIVEDPLYLPSEIDRKLKWILRELDSAVKIRKSLLPTKAYTFGEPRIMCVRAANNTKANYLSSEILMKYNNMLRKICMAKAVYTIPLNSYNKGSQRLFEWDGKTQCKAGIEAFWMDIIHGIKRHDESDKMAEIAQIIKENAPSIEPRQKGLSCAEPWEKFRSSGRSRSLQRDSRTHPHSSRRGNDHRCRSESRRRSDNWDSDRHRGRSSSNRY